MATVMDGGAAAAVAAVAPLAPKATAKPKVACEPAVPTTIVDTKTQTTYTRRQLLGTVR